MALKGKIKEDGCFWVEIQGTTSELAEAKKWVWDLYTGSDKAITYLNNRPLEIYGRVTGNPDQILATTIIFFEAKDAMLFKLTWL